jgi:hypothetical protein
LENAIGILEKEKKMEILFFLNFWPEGLLPLLLISACSTFSPPQPSKPLARFTSREPSSSFASCNGPAQQSTGRSHNALPSLRVAATLGPLVSVAIILFPPHVTEPDTSKESDAAPIPPCRVLHVEPSS